MKYMAKQNTLWKDDTGHVIKVMAGITVVESERKLNNDKPPYFYEIGQTTRKASRKNIIAQDSNARRKSSRESYKEDID